MQMNITRMDSKGRISIPAHVRNAVGIRSGENVLLMSQGKELALLPCLQDTVTVKVLLKELHAMKRLLNVLNSCNFSLLALESFILNREQFECIATLKADKFDAGLFRKQLHDTGINAVEIY